MSVVPPDANAQVFDQRRGARRLAEVPKHVIDALEAGAVSRNHIEQMAIDQGALLGRLFPRLADRADELRVGRFLDRMRAGGSVVLDAFGMSVFDMAPTWRSDTARGWAAFAVADAVTGVSEGVDLASVFAADAHFAVREWAWLGLRRHVVAAPREALRVLEPLTESDSEYLRRFAAEACRPRGVWSRHVPLLLDNPWLGEPLLDRLVGDPHRYVQDSVANWVNDVARTDPAWVSQICDRWAGEARGVSAYVLRRARRSLVGALRHQGESTNSGPNLRADVTPLRLG